MSAGNYYNVYAENGENHETFREYQGFLFCS